MFTHLNIFNQMKLSSLYTIMAGHAYRGKIPEVKGSGIQVIQLKNVTADYINWTGLLESKPATKREPKWLQAGDILFTSRSSKFYSASLVDISDNTKFLAAPQFFVLRQKEGNEVLPEFISWQLNQIPCQKYFQINSEGSIHKTIKKTTLGNTTIKVPSLLTQQKIIDLQLLFQKQKLLLNSLNDENKNIMTAIAQKLEND